MYKVKVFNANAEGKIEFTKEELERLLEEVYNDGYSDATNHYVTVTYGSTPAWNYKDFSTTGKEWWRDIQVTC